MSRVLLMEDVRSMKVRDVQVQPTAKWDNVDIDVDGDTLGVLFAVFLTLPDRAWMACMLNSTDRRVADVLLPLCLGATLYTSTDNANCRVIVQQTDQHSRNSRNGRNRIF